MDNTERYVLNVQRSRLSFIASLGFHLNSITEAEFLIKYVVWIPLCSCIYLSVFHFLFFRLPSYSNTYKPRTSSRFLYLPNTHFGDFWFSFTGCFTFPTHCTEELCPSFTVSCNRSWEVLFMPSDDQLFFHCWQAAICFLKIHLHCNHSHQQHLVTSASLVQFHLPTQMRKQLVKNTTEETPFRKSLLLKDRWSLLCQNVRVLEFFLKVTTCEWEIKYLFEGLRPQIKLQKLNTQIQQLKMSPKFHYKILHYHFVVFWLVFFKLSSFLPSLKYSWHM